VALLAAIALPAHAAQTPAGPEAPWAAIERGLEVGSFPVPPAGESGESVIRILRIDPARFELRLLNASAVPGGKALTPKEWAQQHGLLAVINASMYQEDGRTSVSLMKTRTHTNHPRLSKDNAVLAFDRLDGEVPPVQIIDRACQSFDQLRTRYGTLVQSIRMVSCHGRNVWSPQPNKWSTAAIGIDRGGRVLFIHAREPHATHDLINILLALPIELKNAMYVEGGPQAQLYVRTSDREIELAGRYENSIVSGDFAEAWPIPNIVGVVRKPD
jgi:uncharacterized protein YigE (DUF2233 family)